MDRTETHARAKVPTLAELEQAAFPEHHFSLVDLRQAAYSMKANEPVSTALAAHLDTCEYCKHELTILRETDPVLTGEDDNRLKVLIEAAGNQATADRIEDSAKKTLVAAAGSEGRALCSAAAAFLVTVIPSWRKT
jgi:hypothetical protein